MTPKERAAIQQALKAMKDASPYGLTFKEAIVACEEALEIRCHGCDYCNNPLFAGTNCNNCGRVVEQPVSQEYQDHLVNQSFAWSAMSAKHQFMEGYRIGLAEMREACAKVCDKEMDDWDYESVVNVALNNCAAAIRSIKFEGDTGFRPVSEMIAEHKQDPKKGAAIEKAKVRKAEQEPVAYVYEKDVAGIGMRKDVAFTKHVEVGTDLYSAPVQQAEQEPIGEVDPYMDFLRINWKDDKHPPRGTKLYAAPVRTKDLTDKEALDAAYKGFNDYWTEDCKGIEGEAWLASARAVIEKFKEKNK